MAKPTQAYWNGFMELVRAEGKAHFELMEVISKADNTINVLGGIDNVTEAQWTRAVEAYASKKSALVAAFGELPDVR